MNGVVPSVRLAPSETLRTLSVPTSEASDGRYTVFVIEVGTSSRMFPVRRRYSEFLALHRSLRRQLSQVPTFPGKYLLTKKTFQIIEQRRADLQSYMRTILSIKEARETLLDFLGIALPPTHSPTSAVKHHRMTVLSYNASRHIDTGLLTEVTEECDMGTCVDTLSVTGDGDGSAHVTEGPLEDVTSRRRHRQECFVTSDNVVAGVLLALGHQCTCCHTVTHGDTQ